MTHELKTWIPFYEEMINGDKTFEVRKNDRNFAIGNALLLREYDQMNKCYTGRQKYFMIDYILHGGQFGIKKGFVVIGIRAC